MRNDKNFSSFAEWLNGQFAKNTNLTNGQLSRKIRVGRSLIGKWRRGEVKKPNPKNLHNLAKFFEVDEAFLQTIAWGNDKSIVEVYIHQEEIINEVAEQIDNIEIENFSDGNVKLSELNEYSKQARLIFIVGMVGVGKSLLAKTFYNIRHPRFQNSIQFTAYDDSSVTDIAEYICPFSEGAANIRILRTLKQEPCLLILDDFDLDNQEYIPLLKEIAETKHQSCVIVTCRELPRGYLDWAYRPKVVTLRGLDEPEAIAILQSEGLSPQANKQLVQALIKKYEGIPWGLQLAVRDILELHNGDLAEYIGKTSTVFSRDFSKEIDGVIARLSPLELEVLYWLALQNQSIFYPEIRDEFTDRKTNLIDGNEVDEAVKELNRRLLIEKNEAGIALRTTVQLCAKKQLQKILSKEIMAIAANKIDKLRWLRSLDLADEQIKLCDRFSRYEHILIQALTQLESQPKEQTVDVIGYAIANLRYLLGKPNKDQELKFLAES